MRLWLVVLIGLLSGCGLSVRDGQFVGQVKFVENATPIFCPNRIDTGVSLGVMKNGVGSMSIHDVALTVPNEELAKELRSAVESGAIMKITYDEWRFAFCQQDLEVKKVEVSQ